MKASISIEKERIKLKGEGKKVIVPIKPSQGKPREEPDDANDDIQKLYQTVQNNEDSVHGGFTVLSNILSSSFIKGGF